MKKITVFLTAIYLIGLFLLAVPQTAQSEEKISGTVVRVHFTPCVFPEHPCAIVYFTDGREKTLTSKLIHDIRINEFNVIYYEDNRIVRIEQYRIW